MGLAALSALVGLKYLLFFGVVLLGLGKVLARLTSWTINTACQVLLWRKDFDLSLGGISYRVLGCRLEFLEIDFLSGWLRSRGKLPCLGVVVGGLELRLEALLAEGCGDGGEARLSAPSTAGVAPVIPAPPPPPLSSASSTGDASPLIYDFWAKVLKTAFSQCGITMLGTKLVVDSPIGTAKFNDTRVERHERNKNRAKGNEAGISAEIFISFVEAFGVPLDNGEEGLKLVVRVEQNSEQALLYSSLGTPGGVTLDGSIAFEVEMARAHTGVNRSSSRLYLLSTICISASRFLGVVPERDISALESFWALVISSYGGLPPFKTFAMEETHSPSKNNMDGGLREIDGAGAAGIGSRENERRGQGRVGEDGGGASVPAHEPDETLLPIPFFSMLSPLFCLDATLESFRVDVIRDCDLGASILFRNCGSGGSCVNVQGLGSGDGSSGKDGGKKGKLVTTEPVRSTENGGRGSKSERATLPDSRQQRKSRENVMSAVAEVKGIQFSVKRVVADGSADKSGDVVGKLDVTAKWTSVVLVAGRDVEGDDFDSSVPTRTSSAPSPMDASGGNAGQGFPVQVLPRVRDGYLGPVRAAKRPCVPVHIGMLSVDAEMGMADHVRTVDVKASGRLEFCRFTLSREGLSAMLWLAELIPSSASRQLKRLDLRQQPPLSPPPALFLVASGFGERISYDLSFQVGRTSVVVVADGKSHDVEGIQQDCSANSSREVAEFGSRVCSGDLRKLSSASTSSHLSFDADEGSVMDTENSIQQRTATLIRLTVPRIGIRASSTSLIGSSAAKRRGRIDRTSTEHCPEVKLVEEETGPSIYVTTKLLESYLEVEDPGISVVPPPLTACSQATPGQAAFIDDDIDVCKAGARPPSSSLRNGLNPQVPLRTSFPLFPKCDDVDHPGVGRLPASMVEVGNPLSSPVDASFVSSPVGTRFEKEGVGATSAFSGKANRPVSDEVPETHRLRWLAVRKLSFTKGTVPSKFGVSAGQAEGAKGVNARIEQKRVDESSTTFSSKTEGAVIREDGVVVQDVWAEWSPALFFVAGKSSAMIISCIKDAGFGPPLVSKSGLCYDPLNQWAPPRSRPLPPPRVMPQSPPLSPSPGAGIAAEPMARMEPTGPARGFPADAMELPAVGEPTRAAACFANEVFTDSSPAIDLLWRPKNGVKHVDGKLRVDDGIGASGGDGVKHGGSKGGGPQFGVIEIPQTCAVSARDVRVEFPFQASVCSGDMEHADIIRWLRRFRVCLPSNDCAEARGEHKKIHQIPARDLRDNFSTRTGGAVKSHIPEKDSGSWSCQYVEAQKFDLSVAIAGRSSGESVLPDLSCAIAGVSVSTAKYLPKGNLYHVRSDSSGLQTDSLLPTFALTSDQERGDTEANSKTNSVADSAMLNPPKIRTWTAEGAKAREGGSGCKGGGQHGPPRRFSSACLSVSLGGTRHCSNSREKILHISKFAVVQMTSEKVEDCAEGTQTAPGSRVVDILADGVEGDWSPSTQLLIFKPVREVTLSIWKIMLYLRRAWFAPPSSSRLLFLPLRSPLESSFPTNSISSEVLCDGIKTPRWEDPVALEYWVRAWAAGGPSGPGGDTLHRLHVRSVNMRGRWPAQPQLVADPGNPRVSPRKGSESLFPDDAQDNGVCMQIRVDEFASESVGEHFEFLKTTVDIDGDRLASVSTVNITQTLGDTSAPVPTPPNDPGDPGSRLPTAATTTTYPSGENDGVLYSPPSNNPAERLIVGPCFNELKARAIATDAARAAAVSTAAMGQERSEFVTPEVGETVGKSSRATKSNGSSDPNSMNDEIWSKRPPACGNNSTNVKNESFGTETYGRQSESLGQEQQESANPFSSRQWLMPLVKRPQGFLIEVGGVVLRAEHGNALGKRLDSLVLQAKAMMVAVADLPGRWHPLRGGPCDDFHRLFWNPPLPEEVFVSSSSRPQDRAWGAHVWLRARDLSVEIADEPLEAWFETMHPIWSRELAIRAFRQAIRRRRRENDKTDSVDGNEGGLCDADQEDSRSYLKHVREVFGADGPPPAFPMFVTSRTEALRPDVERSPPCLMRVCVGDVAADVVPPTTGETMCRSFLERLDDHPPPVGTDFGAIIKMNFSVRCANVHASLRQFEQPLFSCEIISARGASMGAWAIAPPSLVGRKLVVIDKTLARLSNISASCGGLVSSVAADAQVEGTCGKGMVLVITRHLPAKLYFDLSVNILQPCFEYSPAHTYALVDMAKAAKLLLPPRFFAQVASERVGAGGQRKGVNEMKVPPLSWWDTGRCLVHGKFDATLLGGVALLVANTHCTHPSTRLPSREVLASSVAASVATAGTTATCTPRNYQRNDGSPPGYVSGAPGGGCSPAGATGAANTSPSPRSASLSLPSCGNRLPWKGSTGNSRKNRASASASRGSSTSMDGEVESAGVSTFVSSESGINMGSYRRSGVGSVFGGGRAYDTGVGPGLGKESGEINLREIRPAKELKVTFTVLRVGWTEARRVALETTGFGVEASPSPAPGLPPFVEIPTLRCTFVTSWHTLGGPSPDHWVYIRPPQSVRLKSSNSLRALHQRPPIQHKVNTDKGNAGSTTTTTFDDVPEQMKGEATRVEHRRRHEGSAEVGIKGADITGMQQGEDDIHGRRDPFELFRGKGVSFQVRVSLPNRPTGEVPPSLPPGVELSEALVSALACLSPRMTVSVFGCCLEWAVEWGAYFSKVPPVPIPRVKCQALSSLGRSRAVSAGCGDKGMGRKKSSSEANLFARMRREVQSLPLKVFPEQAGTGGDTCDGKHDSPPAAAESFSDMVRGLRLGPVSVSEVDVSVYDTTPADHRKQGIRLAVRGGVAAGLSFSVEKSGAINPFATGRVVMPTSSLVVTTVHGLRLRVGKIEVRLCDQDTGSRGNLFLRLRRVALEQGCGETKALSPKGKKARGFSRSRSGHRSESPSAASAGTGKGESYENRAFVGVDGVGCRGHGGEEVVSERGRLSSGSYTSRIDGASEDGDRGIGSRGTVLDDEGVSRLKTGSAARADRVRGRGLRNVEISDGSSSDKSDNNHHYNGFTDGYSSIDDNDNLDMKVLRGSTLGEVQGTLSRTGELSFVTDGLDLTAATDGSRDSTQVDDPESRKPLARGTSAQSPWAIRGGVPPDLNLLPGEALDGVLASLGEGSGDEEGKTSEGSPSNLGRGEVEGLRCVVVGSDDSAEEGVAEISETVSSGIDQGEVEERESDDILASHRKVGSGTWNKRLDAITQAAWLGSKQASCRGFNSNASSASAASSSSNSIAGGPTGSTSNASHRSLSRGEPYSSAGGRNSSTSQKVAPPALPPRPEPRKTSGDSSLPSSTSPSAVIGEETAVEGGASVKSRVGGDRQPVRENETGRGSSGTGEKKGAALGDRVAGSGFLYRVVLDGLNALITLRIRDSLLLMVQSGMDVVLTALPGIFEPSKALLAKEAQGDVHRGELDKRTSLDLKQFIDKPLALPGRRRDSGSLTPYSKAERQSQDSVDSLTDRTSTGRGVAPPTVGVGGNGPVLHKLFSIEIRRTQIQLLGSETANATLLFSMEQGVVQGWVGLDPVEESSVGLRHKQMHQEEVVESCRLQCLAQRLLTTFSEAVTVSLEGTMLSAAPTDVDVDAGVQWLPDSAFAPPLLTTPPTSPKCQSRSTQTPSLPPRPETSLFGDRSRRQDYQRQPKTAESGTSLASCSTAGSMPGAGDGTGADVSAGEPSAVKEINWHIKGKDAAIAVAGGGSHQFQQVPFFGSGEWAAGEFPNDPSRPSKAREDVGVHLSDTASVGLPGSPSFPGPTRAGSSERDSGSGDNWGEGVEDGRGKESPSRARERAAREVLMRQAGTSGIASVFSGGSVSLGSRLGSDTVGSSGISFVEEYLQKGPALGRGRAVFKPVVDRIESLELQVLAHHGAVENHVVKIDLPAITAALNSLQLRLIATVASEVLASPLPNLAIPKAPRGSFGSVPSRKGLATEDTAWGQEEIGPTAMRGMPPWRVGMSASPSPTVSEAWASKRHADWETLELRRFQHCIAEASRVLEKRSAATTQGEEREAKAGDGGLYGSVSLQRFYLVTPQGESDPLIEWAITAEEEALASSLRSFSASKRLRKAVRLLKQRLQQRPNTHLTMHMKRLKLELWRDESSCPFLRAEVRKITADVMVYDDSSGSLDLQVGCVRASQVRGNGYTEGAQEGKGPVETEWWRAGGRGAGSQPLVALEVIKPLMRQDLERLSDKGNLRGWSPRDTTVHVQAQLGSPIGEMTLVRHFEAAIFPLVLQLRRSLFADLAAFSSEAVSALSSSGTGADSAASQREEQLKASFLVSKKASSKQGKSAIRKARLHRSWKAKRSESSSVDVAVPEDGLSARVRSTNGFHGDGVGSGEIRFNSWDAVPDSGDPVADYSGESGTPGPSKSASATKEEVAAREGEPGLIEKPMAVKHLRFGEVNIFLTYMGNCYMELEDVDNVHLKLHPLVYTNKTWTPRKLLLRIRRDVILDVLSQVSRNFSNLGNFLNTRLAPKSSTTTNHLSSSQAAKSAASSSRSCSTGNKTGRSGAARIGKNASSKSGSMPQSLSRKISRPHTPVFLTETFNAVSRSVSPALRPKSLKTQNARHLTTAGGDDVGDILDPVAEQRRRKGWAVPKRRGPWVDSPTSSTEALPSAEAGLTEVVSDSRGFVDGSPITIGPAAAAVAAASEAADAQALIEAELAGMVFSPSRGGDGGSLLGRGTPSRADEHDAKLLLFGRQLGSGSGGGGGLTGSISGKSLISMSLSKGIKKFKFSGKKAGGEGGGGSSAGGGAGDRGHEEESQGGNTP